MTTNNGAYELLDKLEGIVDGARRQMRSSLGLERPPRILPMRGFGTPDGVRVLARVLESRRTGRRMPGRRWRKAFRRWATLEIPDSRIQLRWRDRRWETRSDEEGYIDVTVPAPERIGSGWQSLQLRLVGSRYPDVGTSLRVMVIGPEHDFGVISDIDDTVIDTGVSNVLNLVKSFVYELPQEKQPFPGIDELYRALHHGPDGSSSNPLFYVSSSPMNLYEHLERTFERHGLPEGPLLLRDWGFDRTGMSPNGGHDHKLAKIESVMERTGRLPMILLGDSGQHDPELYREVVERYPDRVLAVAIRDVTPDRRDREVAAIGETIEASGVPFLATSRTEEIASFLAARGFVAASAVDEVAAEAKERAA